MQAVIMAAGRSTRTHPLTATRPKPLVPLWNRPLLEHQLLQLRGIVDEVILVVGFLKERIESRFGDSYRGIRLRYVHQQRQRGTADALLAARGAIDSSVLVLNGDDFYHHDDLEALVRGGRGLLVTQAADPQNRAVVALDGDRVVEIVEKPENPAPGSWCSVGGYSLQREDLLRLDHVQPSVRGELELPDFIRDLVRSTTVRAQRIERIWLPITYSWDVLAAMIFLWEKPERARAVGIAADSHSSLRARPDLEIGAGVAMTGPIHLGALVTVGDGARLEGPLAVGAGSTISRGAVVARSVLFDRVRVGEGAEVRDSVLGEGVAVGASSRLESRAGSELSIDVKGKRVVPEIERLGTVAGDGARIEEGVTVPAGTTIAETIDPDR